MHREAWGCCKGQSLKGDPKWRHKFRASARLLRLLVCSTSNQNILVPTLSQPVQSTLPGPNNNAWVPLPLQEKSHSFLFFTTPGSTPWCNMVCKMKVKLRRQIFPCHHRFHACATENLSSKHCIPLCHLIAGGFMVFFAISRVSSFETDDDTATDDLVGTGQEKDYCMLHRTTLM